MPYTLAYAAAFARTIKKTPDKALKAAIQEAVNAIIADPEAGEIIAKHKTHFRSYHFHRKPEFRLVYKVYDECRQQTAQGWVCRLEMDHPEPFSIATCNGLLDFLYCASREEFNHLYKERWEHLLRE